MDTDRRISQQMAAVDERVASFDAHFQGNQIAMLAIPQYRPDYGHASVQDWIDGLAILGYTNQLPQDWIGWTFAFTRHFAFIDYYGGLWTRPQTVNESLEDSEKRLAREIQGTYRDRYDFYYVTMLMGVELGGTAEAPTVELHGFSIIDQEAVATLDQLLKALPRVNFVHLEPESDAFSSVSASSRCTFWQMALNNHLLTDTTYRRVLDCPALDHDEPTAGQLAEVEQWMGSHQDVAHQQPTVSVGQPIQLPEPTLLEPPLELADAVLDLLRNNTTKSNLSNWYKGSRSAFCFPNGELREVGYAEHVKTAKAVLQQAEDAGLPVVSMLQQLTGESPSMARDRYNSLDKLFILTKGMRVSHWGPDMDHTEMSVNVYWPLTAPQFTKLRDAYKARDNTVVFLRREAWRAGMARAECTGRTWSNVVQCLRDLRLMPEAMGDFLLPDEVAALNSTEQAVITAYEHEQYRQEHAAPADSPDNWLSCVATIPGVVIDDRQARETHCLRVELDSGQVVVYSPGISGPLDDDQQILYCVEGTDTIPASPEMRERIEAINGSAAQCNLEAANAPADTRTASYFNCLQRELQRKGVHC